MILQFEERVQRGQGPGIFQPYRDLWKLFHKQIVAPETASWLYWAAPIVAFTTMLTVPILIPVLTNYPLPLSDMGDILGGGLILTLGSFMITLAGLDTRSAYGGIGSSRAVMVGILAEPTLILVFVGITLLAKAMLPFVVNHLLVAEPAIYWGPTHLFLVAAFFILLLVETDRLPIHSSTHIEVYMIDEARILEYSGPMLAILRWAAMMKQFILYTIFCNVLLLPWGLSAEGTPLGVLGATVALALKFLLVACVVVRRRHHPVPPALLPLSGAARPILPARDPRHRRNAVELSHACRPSRARCRPRCSACLRSRSLLLSFVMLGSRWLRHYLFAFAAQSWLIAILSAAVGILRRLSRTLHHRRPDGRVPGTPAALSDPPDHSPDGRAPGGARHPAGQLDPGDRGLRGRLRPRRRLRTSARRSISAGPSRCWR